MSPASILRIICTRLTKVAGIDEVGTPRGYTLPGAIDGYDRGWSALVVDKRGHTYRVAVTLYALGVE